MRRLIVMIIALIASLSMVHSKTETNAQGLQEKYKQLFKSFINLKSKSQQRYQKLLQKFNLIQSLSGANHIYNNYFSYTNYNLSYASGQKAYTQFIFHDVVDYEQVYAYTIKVHKLSGNKYLMIGVVDFNKQKGQRNSHTTNNALSYNAKGDRYPECGPEGKGFDQGDTVLVEVDRKNKIIVWYVNEVRRASYTHEILGDRKRVFMPYVEMADNYDLIEVSFGPGAKKQEKPVGEQL